VAFSKLSRAVWYQDLFTFYTIIEREEKNYNPFVIHTKVCGKHKTVKLYSYKFKCAYNRCASIRIAGCIYRARAITTTVNYSSYSELLFCIERLTINSVYH